MGLHGDQIEDSGFCMKCLHYHTGFVRFGNRLLEDTAAGFQIPPGAARVCRSQDNELTDQAQVPPFLAFKSKQGKQLPTTLVFRKLLSHGNGIKPTEYT